MAKISRNQPCPCGSGSKYKHCHGRLDGLTSMADIEALFKRKDAEDRIRRIQQGEGKPVIGVKTGRHQIVGVGNTIYFSESWKTFPDFLADYIKKKLDPAWGNAEIAKPLSARHPLMQWYDAYCRYQQRVIKVPGQVNSYPITGVVACYMGVAYTLYLLDHNVELQSRLIKRLMNPSQFQGAYYELVVASILIRAGFRLTLQDESDRSVGHCEFDAVSKQTGKLYSVEAKMRGVAGLLGRTSSDGSPEGKSAISSLVPQLNKALAKPATGERLIFIDLNAPTVTGPDGKPDWLEPAMQRLEKYERDELVAGVTGYLFVTNMAFHRDLDGPPSGPACPFGLGLPDFNRPGMLRISDIWRQRLKHADAFAVAKGFESFTKMPVTFDGSLPSQAFGEPRGRVLIGEIYEFPDENGGPSIIGKVTTTAVDEGRSRVTVAVRTAEGMNAIIELPMTEQELADYREFRDGYFGEPVLGPHQPKDAFELFEWLMNAHKATPRENMLKWFGPARDRAALEAMSNDDLRIEYCEALVGVIQAQSGPWKRSG